jgi:arabinose-5-phosphate isomerase
VSGADRAAERDPAKLLEEGRRVLRLEAAAVSALEARLGDAFVAACELLAETPGRVIVSGIGKSGIVARKIAATLTSTGTPATFLHPVEGMHGDLGIVSRSDVALLVSKSGETSELGGLIDYLLRLGVPIIALTGEPRSALARHARAVLDCAVAEEACPMDLAPTSSTTAALAMGDALAVAVFRRKGFGPEHFAALHPGGALGRKLNLRVEEVMVGTDFPSLPQGARMKDAVVPIAKLRGTVPVVDGGGKVVGVVTAGDLTRLMERDEKWAACPVADVMTRDPRTAVVGELASAAVHRMEESRIMALPVVDERGVLRGVVHLHDLLRSGAV